MTLANTTGAEDRLIEAIRLGHTQGPDDEALIAIIERLDSELTKVAGERDSLSHQLEASEAKVADLESRL